MQRITTAVLTLAAGTSAAAAQSLPQVAGEMKHIFITFDGSAIDVSVDNSLPGDPAASPVELVGYAGDAPYTGAAGVLDGRFYSARYGWLQNGFIDLDLDDNGSNELSIWIEHTSSSPGLEVYEGGMRMMRGSHTYTPILGTDGSSDRWNWPVSMMHNWYAVDAVGFYEATYDVYIGDEFGNRLPGFSSDSVTLAFSAIPSPATPALLAGAIPLAARRRRG